MDLNTILIILGVVALIILVAHGLWANRREKSQYFQNANTFTKDSRVQVQDNQFHSQERTVNSSQTANNSFTASVPSAPPIAPQATQQSLNFDEMREDPQTYQHDIQNVEQAVSQIKISLPNSPTASQATTVQEEFYPTGNRNASQRSIAERSIAELESQDNVVDLSSEQLRQQLADAALQPAVELSRAAPSVQSVALEPTAKIEMEEMVQPQAQQHEVNNNQAEQDNAFMLLYIVAPENRFFGGELLAQALDNLGFIYGAQQIYHRHLDLSISSPILFSVANIQDPGTFDPYNMADFHTVGVVLFMQLPSQHGDDLTNLRMMIRTAKNLAEELGGFVLTDQQQIFTAQDEQDYLNRVKKS
ncbi:MAG: cell division protein ZipA [[Pasteurella] mairii]|uniref:Cell division protein ZipA n=1 Tax=[Pasteurella] mairii TaxID=757 RepID=A0A379B2S8_9PAST|nr:cell division protein ZipA [[Pasteurella] mairii]SUB32923.1 cell division protein ZipA [[Pasteurella] mairii]